MSRDEEFTDASAHEDAPHPSFVFPARALFPFSPNDILPAMPGRSGISIQRIFAATSLFAASLGLMKLVPNLAAAAVVLPLWCASVGSLIDGFRGATRGIILAVVYPIYCSILIAIGVLVFWFYAVLHKLIAGDAMLY